MGQTTRRNLLLAVVAASALLSSCRSVRSFLRDPAGDDRIFTGDPNAFVGKEVIVQFRWGDPRMYGQALRCVVTRVEQAEIVVRGLLVDDPNYQRVYQKLLNLGKLTPVEDQAHVFRIRRDDIARIFEPTKVRGEG